MYGRLNLTAKQFANHYCNTIWFGSSGDDKILKDLLYWVDQGHIKPVATISENPKERPLFHYWQIYHFDTLRREHALIVDRDNHKHRIPYPTLNFGERQNLCASSYVEYSNLFALLGNYVNQLYYGDKDTSKTKIESILKQIDSEHDETWRNFLHELCLQWRDYYVHKQVGLRNHLRRDIDCTVDLIQRKFNHTYVDLKFEIGKGKHPTGRFFYDSLLDWVYDGDLYAQLANSKLILFTNRSLAEKLVLNGKEVFEEDASQICEYAIQNDQILLLHSLSWLLDSSNPDLGQGYYYTEAIRILRESAISIETMLADFAYKKGIYFTTEKNLCPRLTSCFKNEVWWKEFVRYYDTELGSTNTESEMLQFLGRIGKLDSKSLTLAQAFAIVARIRNISSHTAKYSKELFDAAFGICQDSIAVVIYYLWYWLNPK
jgi:hypothetical protein